MVSRSWCHFGISRYCKEEAHFLYGSYSYLCMGNRWWPYTLSPLTSECNLWGAIFQMKCLHRHKKPFYPMPRCNNESTRTAVRHYFSPSIDSPHASFNHPSHLFFVIMPFVCHLHKTWEYFILRIPKVEKFKLIKRRWRTRLFFFEDNKLEIF